MIFHIQVVIWMHVNAVDMQSSAATTALRPFHPSSHVRIHTRYSHTQTCLLVCLHYTTPHYTTHNTVKTSQQAYTSAARGHCLRFYKSSETRLHTVQFTNSNLKCVLNIRNFILYYQNVSKMRQFNSKSHSMQNVVFSTWLLHTELKNSRWKWK